MAELGQKQIRIRFGMTYVVKMPKRPQMALSNQGNGKKPMTDRPNKVYKGSIICENGNKFGYAAAFAQANRFGVVFTAIGIAMIGCNVDWLVGYKRCQYW